ncbi:MAG: hypothetical protein LKH93_06780 [Clostridium beijerinckii]|jgi:hypothetical protein|nr:hypothetical protein [Clostridium beijerinckii]MCI1578606.1 hypothetical protein [Clostridium beijerinckii]MCI1582062.1 hypothetical protein [Clostridium beijerinckii]MCI1621912.1 hypothetical protein [Clostridium beijerinckii]
MNRYDVEILYHENGLNDYKLTSLEDLKNCHGIDAEKVKGYEDLTEENKVIFKKFIINYFNARGIDARMITTPKAINYVEDIDHVAQDPDDEECVVSVCNLINVIKADGRKRQLHKYVRKEYKDLVPTEHYRKEYLRFAFLEGKSKVWLHVTHEGKQWY